MPRRNFKKYGPEVIEVIIEMVFEKANECGIDKCNLKIVNKMSENGLSNSDIRKYTGLPLKNIVVLLANFNETSVSELRDGSNIEKYAPNDIGFHIEKLIKKGIEYGIEKRAMEIVLKIAESGISNLNIRKITGLSISKIMQIKRKGGK